MQLLSLSQEDFAAVTEAMGVMAEGEVYQSAGSVSFVPHHKLVLDLLP